MQLSAASIPARSIAAAAPSLSLLIIDEDHSAQDYCRQAAQWVGLRATVAESAEHGYQILEHENTQLVLLNLKLSGCNGFGTLREVLRRRPNAVVIIVAAHARVGAAVEALKQGAFDYIATPFNVNELRVVLQRAYGYLQSAQQPHRLEAAKPGEGQPSLVGYTPQIERLHRIIANAAESSHPVLIMGESGSGKHLVARCIHGRGPHRDRPFIAVECGALSPAAMESELFGHLRGAVPGATRAKEGVLSLARGGTVFLDEIGELPTDIQAKVLHAIQEKEIQPVGSTRYVPFEARILAATNRDLETAVAEGNFRRDLFFRLNVLTLRIPPLRQRKQDIPLLVQHFAERLERTSGEHKDISDNALEALVEYDWPGNVRELENCIERAWAMCSGSSLHASDLPSSIINTQVYMNNPKPTYAKIVPLAEMEKQAILTAIEQLNGDKLLAAKMLGIGKTTLYRKLKEYTTQS